MVWGLFPVEPQRGVSEYYIFAKGAYKVGRKDCDVIVQTDTSISRVHAEIIVDEMVSRDPVEKASSNSPSYARIVDRSKYGTVINKEEGANASRLKKDQEVMLNDGDLITFGTGNATFRFSLVPVIMFLHNARSKGLKSTLKEKIRTIGAYWTNSWSSECTHAIVEKSSSMDNNILQAVLARKPVVLSSWVDMLAGKTIWTEIPSCATCIPDLALDGSPVKVVEPNFREKLLKGYHFVLGFSNKYIFEDNFQSLLEVAGGNCVSIDEFRSSSQTSGDEMNQFVLVITAESANKWNHLQELSSLSRVMDRKLVSAILSGHFDSTIIEQPPYIVSSSHSTDETIVADSDVEKDTAVSHHTDDISKSKVEVLINDERGHDVVRKSNHPEEDTIYMERQSNVNNSMATDRSKTFSGLYEDADIMKKTKRLDELHADRHENSDILYSQDLIVRTESSSCPLRSAIEGVINFKRFRKKETVSGNSFKNLIQFSKDPYKESDFGSNETSDYLKQEKKRKQLEAIAEDLFNNEKASKRSTAGASLQALFSRR